jgi:hypothetical protein
MDSKYNSEQFAHINVYIDHTYKFTFGYPVLIVEVMTSLRERIERTRQHTDDVSRVLGNMIDLLAERLLQEDFQNTENQYKNQLVFLLCGLILQLSDEKQEQPTAGKQYNLHLVYQDDEMLVQMYEMAVTLH